ncbi:MAG: sigma-70 family RNA polymerase sigma factor [Acidobacteria bacterium]|nr:sigma-70 family RNA polymerase sigma factor [Acidobacteriota bacterium]
MDDIGDVELMRRVRGGDHAAFESIVDRYRVGLVNYLTHMTANRERAEEFAQEAFVRLYEVAGRYEERGKLAPYLFRIATNLVRSDARRNLRWRTLVPMLPMNGNGVAPGRALIEAELRAKVGAAIAALPLPFRAPLILREMEEWSYQEIASALSCDEGTVKSRIHRARQKLKEQLAPYWNGGLSHE